MKIKLTKALPARQIHLAVLAPGSIIDIDDRTAMRLIGKYADETKESKEILEAKAAKDAQDAAEAAKAEQPVQPFEAESTKGDSMLVKFLQPADVDGRHYEPGEIKPIASATAQKMIDDGVAQVASLFEHETPDKEPAESVAEESPEDAAKPKRKAKK